MIGDVKDYYELLGLSRKASGEEIRKAFRRLARRFHPDLADDKTRAEEKFKEINEAYEVLGDPDSRRKYDRGEGRWQRFAGFGSRHVRPRNASPRRESWKDPFRPYTERPEFRSFYEDFFGGRRQGTRGFSDGNRSDSFHGRREFRQDETPRRGNDIEGEISISLGEVLHGSIHTVAVLRNNPLTEAPERRPLHVRVPAGIRDGHILRLLGRGDYGSAGGPPGDLCLKVKVTAHPDLRVQGTDLFFDLELNPWEAFFGGKKTVPTIEGSVSVKIPAGTASGQQLRLRGRGLPNESGDRGHLYAVVSIRVRLGELARKVFRRGR